MYSKDKMQEQKAFISFFWGGDEDGGDFKALIELPHQKINWPTRQQAKQKNHPGGWRDCKFLDK